MIRRRLLVNTTFLAPVALLVACALNPTSPNTPVISQAALDANLIATGLEAGIAQVTAEQTTPSPAFTAAVAKLNGYLTTIQNDAAQVAAATATPPTSTLNEIETDAKAILTVVSPFLPDGSLILPIFTAAIDLGADLLGTAGASVTPRPGAYSAQQSRAILAAARKP